MFFYWGEYSTNKEPKYKVGSKVERTVRGRRGYKTYELTVVGVSTQKGEANKLFAKELVVITAYRHTYQCSDETGAVFTAREDSLKPVDSNKPKKTRYYVMDSFTGEITKQHIVINRTTRRSFKTTADYIGHVLGIDPALIEVK